MSRRIKFWPKKKISSGSKPELSNGLKAEVERLGLFLLKDNTAAINNIDIVAVHGLGGHYLDTWTGDNKNLWLRDSVPSKLNDSGLNSRVFSYGYDSSTAFSKAVTDITDEAAMLLDRIKGERKSQSERHRPIILIAHSLGGILVKKAMIIAHERSSEYGELLGSIKAAMFLGTPHRGSDVAYWATYAANVLKVLQLGRGTNASFVSALQRNSPEFANISQQWIERAAPLKIRTFYETERFLGELIVDKDSARLGIVNEIAIGVAGANHRSICKFSDFNSQKYKTVWNATEELAQYALRPSSTSTTSDYDSQCLPAWRLTDPREDKDRILTSKNPLLKGSCIWILNDRAFTEWWNNDKCSILWIHGDPGKGKTMMMIALIDEIQQRLDLIPRSGVLSYFFCQNTIQELNNAVSIVRGLTYLLAKQNPALTRYLRKRYNETDSRPFEGLNALHGLWIMLSEILNDPSLPRVYLLVDALDECDSQSLEIFLILLSQSRLSNKVKWVVTSRNETKIIEHLYRSPLGHDTSLELNSSYVSEAVKSFINFKVRELADRKTYSSELQTSVREYLTEHANGTFLWVALVCKELEKVLAGRTKDILRTFPAGLEPLYERMIGQVEHERDLVEVRLCKQILCTVTLACRPLGLNEMGIIAGLPEDVLSNPQYLQDLVGSCGSFLTLREQTVYLVHQSAKDYFSTGKGSHIFPFGQIKAHDQLAHRSLQLMLPTLKRDICGIRAPGALAAAIDSGRVQQRLPPEVQYACIYWVQHLQRSSTQLYDDDQVHQFLREHLLHWLEALSWIGKTSEGILAILSLEAQTPANKSPNLHAFVYDAKRFVLYNRLVIEQAPLQLYCSALIFAPEKSIVRRQFKKYIPTWIQIKPRVQANWSAALQTLEGHSGSVMSVAFSPDGKLMASGSSNRTVRLWDAVTGAALQTLEGHSHWVRSVAFSPGGKLVASGSDDETVRLWDAVTGAALQTLEGHLGLVTSVAFSPDGKLVASGSGDKTVRLWDAVTGVALQTLEGHSGSVMSVAFSPDGKLVASGSNDETVRLWDAVTGPALQTLEGHSGSVTSVAFSPDGKLVASGSVDKTVRLRDVVTGAALQTLEGHSGWVTSVAFSPDGKLVASGSVDETVRLWDAVTGPALQALEGHSNSITSVAFSPDGKLVASGSHDETVRLWDAVTGPTLQTLEGHSRWVTSVAFSPDGKLVASSSGDETVRLWDAVTGAARQTLEGHSHWVMSVAFSPDGKLVASGSHDKTVRLWDAVTGAALQTLEGYSCWVMSVAFSPDGKLVASGSVDETGRGPGDETVRLWDAVTGAALQALEGYSGSVTSVAFSPDGKLVASGSSDETVRLWDAVTGPALQTLEGHSGSVTSVTFSPDGKLVASGSSDETVRLWDAVTGVALQTLEGHSGSVTSVAFSPDGKLVASGSNDETIRLWDAVTGAALQTLQIGVVINNLLFSTLGQYLKTDRGVMDITSLKVSLDSLEQLRSLFVSNNWIKEEGENILWLPPNYRATCVAVWNAIVILGHSSGGISFLQFKEGLKLI